MTLRTSPHTATAPRPRAKAAGKPDAPAASPRQAGRNLGPIEVLRSCEVLAEQLHREIVDGRYPAGAPLPTERELVADTGLSRGSVREALRILEAQGLVRTRPGRYGGSVVAKPSDASLGGHIHAFAKVHGVPVQALVEARQALEPQIAWLAARNRSDADLAELHAIAARLDDAAVDDVPRFLQENAHWHTALATAAHNDLLRAFTASISLLMLEVSRIESFASPDVRKLVSTAHRRILQAIEAQDAETARRRATRDIEAYAAHLQAALQLQAKPAPATKAKSRKMPAIATGIAEKKKATTVRRSVR